MTFRVGYNANVNAGDGKLNELFFISKLVSRKHIGNFAIVTALFSIPY